MYLNAALDRYVATMQRIRSMESGIPLSAHVHSMKQQQVSNATLIARKN
jgi:hypothetical protein